MVKTRPSLSLPQVEQLYALLLSWGSGASSGHGWGMTSRVKPRCIVLQGAGGKAFCTGGDVRTAVTRSQAGEIEAVEGFFRIEYLLVFAIANLHITSVALIDGLVMGGGVGVSIYASFRVATERCVRAVKEAGLATHYISSKAIHLVGPALAALGELASDHITVHQTLCDLEALYPPPGHEVVLHSRPRPTATVGSSLPVVQAKEINRASKLARRMNWIQHHFQHESMEAIVLSLQRAVTASAVAAASAGYPAGADGTIKLHGLLQESSDFASETLKVLSRSSPLSQKVTLSLMQRMQNASLASCLDADWVLVDRFEHRQGDFFEGVRAMLIDRTNDPKWKYATLEEIPKSVVDAFFTPGEGLTPLFGVGRGSALWGGGGCNTADESLAGMGVGEDGLGWDRVRSVLPVGEFSDSRALGGLFSKL
ncbi:MAG: hypothetical protein WDW38_007243 [Sanguina aurantia]